MATYKIYDLNNFVFIEGIDNDVYLPLGKSTVQIIETGKNSQRFELIRTSGFKTINIGDLIIGNLYTSNDVLWEIDEFRDWITKNTSSFSQGGGNGQGVADIGIREVDAQTYDIAEEDDGDLINMKYGGDWVVNLPDIAQVADDFRGTMMHKKPGDFIGDVVPRAGDTIDGNLGVKMYGQGLISVRKITLNESHGWFVFSQVSYNDVQLQGKTRVLEFNNQTVVSLTHNLGFIPVVQVWVEDGNGGYIHANVDIDHNWSSRNEFTATFSEEVSGKILY